MREAFVTGGGGFIGRYVVRALLDRGIRVRVFDVAALTPPIDGWGRNVEIVRATVTDRGAVRRAVRGADTVYHLAANPHLWAPDRKSFAAVNAEGTRIVLEEAAEAGARRIVHTSTESIFSRLRDDGRLIDERQEARLDWMAGAYCRSKLAGERTALAMAALGAPVVIVNPTLPVGPGDPWITPPTRMILDFVNGTHPAYLDFAFNMIDVRDVALGHVLAAEKGRIGERYILGNRNMRLSELLRLLQEITGLPMPKLRFPYPFALAYAVLSELAADLVTGKPPGAPVAGVRLTRTPLVFDCSKAIRELGLPQSPVAEAIAEEIAWLDRQGHIRRALPHLRLDRAVA